MAKKALYLGALIILAICLLTVFSRFIHLQNKIDAYVSDSFSRDIRDIQNTVNNMCLELSYDGKYKYYSIEEMQEIVTAADKAIYECAYRMTDYTTLNRNFEIRFYSLREIIEHVEETLNNGRKLSAEEFAILNQLVILNNEYTDLGNSRIYLKDKNSLDPMKMPEIINEYLDKIEELEEEYDKLVEDQ